VIEKKTYGAGRVLYWAHAAGVTEKRGSVRSGGTAFELMPLTTARNPYENVLLVDLGTHPRLIHAHNLMLMLPPGVHLTDLARRSMPALARDCLEETRTTDGEIVWTVNDTTKAFEAYWMDEGEPDYGIEALEEQHARIRALAGPACHIPLNAFPIPYEMIIPLRSGNLYTVADMAGLDFHEMRALCGLSTSQLAHALRIVEGTLRVREVEADPTPVAVAAE